jgi:hypothetical protein
MGEIMGFNKKVKVFFRVFRVFLRRIESYFIGNTINKKNIHCKQLVIIDKSDMDLHYIQSILKELLMLNKLSVLVFIGPFEDFMLLNILKGYPWLGILCLYPTSINDVSGMLNILGYYLEDALLILSNLSQLPCVKEEKNTKYFTTFYKVVRQAYMMSKEKSWAVILMDGTDNLGEKNSAIIRRYFNK